MCIHPTTLKPSMEAPTTSASEHLVQARAHSMVADGYGRNLWLESPKAFFHRWVAQLIFRGCPSRRPGVSRVRRTSAADSARSAPSLALEAGRPARALLARAAGRAPPSASNQLGLPRPEASAQHLESDISPRGASQGSRSARAARVASAAKLRPPPPPLRPPAHLPGRRRCGRPPGWIARGIAAAAGKGVNSAPPGPTSAATSATSVAGWRRRCCEGFRHC